VPGDHRGMSLRFPFVIGPPIVPFATGATGQYFPWLRRVGRRTNTQEMSPAKGSQRRYLAYRRGFFPRDHVGGICRDRCQPRKHPSTNMCLVSVLRDHGELRGLGRPVQVRWRSPWHVLLLSERDKGQIVGLACRDEFGTRSRDRVGSSSSSPSSLLRKGRRGRVRGTVVPGGFRGRTWDEFGTSSLGCVVVLPVRFDERVLDVNSLCQFHRHPVRVTAPREVKGEGSEGSVWVVVDGSVVRGM
jgi:hypothetical protein